MTLVVPLKKDVHLQPSGKRKWLDGRNDMVEYKEQKIR